MGFSTMRGPGSLNFFFFFFAKSKTLDQWWGSDSPRELGMQIDSWYGSGRGECREEGVKVGMQVEKRSAQAESLFGILHIFWEQPGARCITRVSCDETSCEVLKLEFIAGTSTLHGTPAHDWVEGLSRRRGLFMHLGCVTPCGDDKPGTLRPQRKCSGNGGSPILS